MRHSVLLWAHDPEDYLHKFELVVNGVFHLNRSAVEGSVKTERVSENYETTHHCSEDVRSLWGRHLGLSFTLGRREPTSRVLAPTSAHLVASALSNELHSVDAVCCSRPYRSRTRSRREFDKKLSREKMGENRRNFHHLPLAGMPSLIVLTMDVKLLKSFDMLLFTF